MKRLGLTAILALGVAVLLFFSLRSCGEEDRLPDELVTRIDTSKARADSLARTRLADSVRRATEKRVADSLSRIASNAANVASRYRTRADSLQHVADSIAANAGASETDLRTALRVRTEETIELRGEADSLRSAYTIEVAAHAKTTSRADSAERRLAIVEPQLDTAQVIIADLRREYDKKNSCEIKFTGIPCPPRWAVATVAVVAGAVIANQLQDDKVVVVASGPDSRITRAEVFRVKIILP